MKLISIKQGLYPGYIRDYNIKTSDRTGKKYLNLNLLIDTFKQEADVQNHRIYTKGRMLIYQLNTDNNTSVRIEDGECEIEETPDSSE